MRIIHPSYYDESLDTAYPFDSSASRTNGSVSFDNDIFVDARIFIPDSRIDVYISKVNVSDTVTITLSDGRGILGTAEFPRNDPPDVLHFWSATSTYLGLLQSLPSQDGQAVTAGATSVVRGLSKLCGWPDGEHTFTQINTRFAATVLVPQPQVTVRSIKIPSGDIFHGDVWLVGENGVQLTVERDNSNSSSSLSSSAANLSYDTIRVDVVGNPLFTREQCEDQGITLGASNFVKGIVFEGQTIYPDETGGFTIQVARQSDGSEMPALRVVPIQNGLKIGFLETSGV